MCGSMAIFIATMRWDICAFCNLVVIFTVLLVLIINVLICPTHLQSLSWSLDIFYELLERFLEGYSIICCDRISFLDHKDRCNTFVYFIKLILYVLEWQRTTAYICPPYQFICWNNYVVFDRCWPNLTEKW